MMNKNPAVMAAREALKQKCIADLKATLEAGGWQTINVEFFGSAISELTLFPIEWLADFNKPFYDRVRMGYWNYQNWAVTCKLFLLELLETEEEGTNYHE